MNFFLLLKGELNKILMRPILYVITAIIVFALFLSYMFFTPSERIDGQVNTYDNCKNISELYTTFKSNTNQYGKPATDLLVSNNKNALLLVKQNNESTALSEFESLLNDISINTGEYAAFDNVPPAEDDTASSQEQATYSNLRAKYEQLQTKFKTYQDMLYSPMLITSDDSFNLLQLFSSTLNAFEINKTSHKSNVELRKTLSEMRYFEKIYSLFSNIIPKKVDDSQLESLSNYGNLVSAQLVEIEEEIEQINANGNAEKFDELKSLALRYYLTGSNLNTLTSNVLKYSSILNKTDSQINSYYGYEKTYSYEVKEKITKCKFLIDNNAVSTDYANVFSSNKTSNQTKNAFDFVYFGLEITSFIIIVFTVVLSAGMLAGEQSNGTLKLLLIRPYSRNKVLTSKLLASLIFGVIFLIFSTIVLFLIGLFTMGANFTPVLCVFNASLAFTCSPFVLLLIYLLCLIFKILIFALLSLAISAIFKSNVGAVGVSIVLYFLLSVLGIILSGSYWYGYLPFSNIDLFKYFGGAFVGGTTSPISMISSSPMFYGGNFLYSFLITIGVGLIFAILTYEIFKRREIK